MITLLEYISKSAGSEYKEYDPKAPENWSVGDVLYGIAGYSMSLPEFYKIVRKTNKKFIVRRLEGKIVSGSHNGQWTEVATDEFDDRYPKEEQCGVNKWGYVRLGGKYGVTLRLWDGQPIHGDDMD